MGRYISLDLWISCHIGKGYDREGPEGPSELTSSKVCSINRSVDTIWEPTRHGESQVPPGPIQSKSLGDSSAYSSSSMGLAQDSFCPNQRVMLCLAIVSSLNILLKQLQK